MVKSTRTAREIVRDNVRALMLATALRTPELSRQSGLDRKTINNLIHGRNDPQSATVAAIARAFKITAQELLDPDFDPQLANNEKLKSLIRLYKSADPEAQDTILHVAQTAARYK